MRRWLTAVALGGAATLSLTGCANPGGVDGDLTNDWTTIGEPVAFLPEAGTCHPRFQEIGYLSAYQPVDCAQSHAVETLHLGTFTGEDAERLSPPPAGSPSLRTARAECEAKTKAALGADWHSARLSLSVVLPSSYAWSGGARWFRCDVGEVESLDDRDLVTRTGSLKDALRTSSELTYGCFRPKLVKDDLDGMTPVSCTAKHRSEFVGIWVAPDVPYDSFKKDTARTHKGCVGVIASFAKVPNDGDIKYRVGSIYYSPHKDDWEAGDRSVLCFLWISDRDLTRSLKGAGTKGLPIN